MFSVFTSGKFNILSLLFYLFLYTLFSALFVLYIITLIIYLLRLSFVHVKTTRNSYPHDFIVNLLPYIVKQSTS